MPGRRRSFAARSIHASRPTRGLSRTSTRSTPSTMPPQAYIRSQAHAGWSLLRAKYEDGGFSGGNTDRPALQRLLDDVRVGKIDVIVVYKVDRLTRSRLPHGMGVVRLADLPAEWSRQHQMLGLPA